MKSNRLLPSTWQDVLVAGVTTAGLMLASIPSWSAPNGAKEKPDTSAGGSSWVDGDEAPVDDDVAPAKRAPRNSSAPNWDLDTPKLPPESPQPIVPMPAPTSPLRRQTELNRSALERFGALRLNDALAWVPGIWVLPRQGLIDDVSARGASPDQLALRVDGVPMLVAQTQPEFAPLSLWALNGVERVRVRPGARLLIGAPRALSGVIDIDTFPPVQELGSAIPLRVALRGGYGGPDRRKSVQIRGQTGMGRARVGVNADFVDVEDLRQGRGGEVLRFSNSRQGTLGSRFDVVARPWLWLFGSWRSARTGDTPVPDRCLAQGDAPPTDCVRVVTRAHDALIVGADARWHALGGRGQAKWRAHTQRFYAVTQRFGRQRPAVERNTDTTFRGGTNLRGEQTLPALFATRWRPSVHLGLEALQDRVVSTFRTRSQFRVDAPLPGEGIADDTRSALVSGSQTQRADMDVGVRLDGPAAGFGVKLGAGVFRWAAPAPYPGDLLQDWQLGQRAATQATLRGEVSARIDVSDGLTLRWSGWRTQLPDTLVALTGRSSLLHARPAVALPGTSRISEWGGETTVTSTSAWLDLSATAWAAYRTGGLRSPFDPSVGDPSVGNPSAPNALQRAQPLPPQALAGVEGTFLLRTGMDGLQARGVFAGLAADDVEVWSLRRLPSSGVLQPVGTLSIIWAPKAWPVGFFVRSRIGFPHLRLSAIERLDPVRCPGGPARCRAAAGYALFDLGASVRPSDAFEISAIAENMGDAAFHPVGQALPGGGQGARVTLSLQF